MILTGNEDLRVRKTITGIKAAFEALICEKAYDRITVKELCDRAQVNKKTFYHYYETLDALLGELQMELSSAFLGRIRRFRLPEELDKVNREFFLYSAEQGMAYEKITVSGMYHAIRDEMIAGVNEAGWGRSEAFNRLTDYQKRMLMTFVNNASLGAYRQWIEDGKRMPLEDVIEMTNCLVLGGVKRFTEKNCG